MAAPFPSYTKTWHSSTYGTIDPSRPELSGKGKVVVITGGAGSIGTSMARAFSIAGAKAVIILGRTEKTLSTAKDSVLAIVKDANIQYYVADIMDATSFTNTMNDIAATHGKIDVFINNAAFLSAPAPVAESDPQDWWRSFEVNVLGSFNAIRAFLAVAKEDAMLINTSTAAAIMPAFPALSAYTASKLATTKFIEALQAEQPNLHVLNLHPGVVVSDLNIKSGIPGMDDAELPGDFTLWAASPEAKFLKGKFVWINWDADELKERAAHIQDGPVLTVGLDDWTAKGWAGF